MVRSSKKREGVGGDEGETRGNPNMISNEQLKEKLKAAGVSDLPEKCSRQQLLWHCLRANALSDQELLHTLPTFSVLRVYMRSCVSDVPLRDRIERIVNTTTEFYALGSRMLNYWAVENSVRLSSDSEFFERTLADIKFIKDALRCGRKHANLPGKDLTESKAFATFAPHAPSLDDLTGLLPLSAWSQIFGFLGTSYHATIKEHVTRHLKTRIMSHLKRCIVSKKGVVLRKRNNLTMVEGWPGHDGGFAITDAYSSIGSTTLSTTLPKEVRDLLVDIRGFLSEREWKALTFSTPPPFSSRTFALHMHLRSLVPPPSHNPDLSDGCHGSEPSYVSAEDAEEEREGEEIAYKYRGKGWSPLPISGVGRVHVTIDQKVLEGLKSMGLIPKHKTLSEALGCDQKAIEKRRRVLSKRLKSIRKANDRRRARKSVWMNGPGKPPKGFVTSITTDAVGMSIRYTRLDETAVRKLKAWDGVGEAPPKPKAHTHTKIASHAYGLMQRLVSEGKTVRKIGIDDGRAELFHSAEKETMNDGSSTFVHHRFRREKYLEVSLRNRMQACLQKEKTREISFIEGELAKRGGWKARTEDDYGATADAFMQHGRHKAMIDHYCDAEFSLWRMRVKRRSDSVLVQRFKLMLGRKRKGEAIIIGYGDANTGKAGKGETPVPTCRKAVVLTKYIRSVKADVHVLPTQEYLTTQMCHCCKTRMTSFCVNGRAVRGLKLCKSERCSHDGSPAFRSRDGNAARNILECLTAMLSGNKRPEYLSPPRKTRSANVAGDS